MFLVAKLISFMISTYILVIIVQVALSWLVAFDIINANNEAARNLGTLLKKLTDPVYKPLRKYIPPIGGIDITPMIVIIGLQLIGSLFAYPFYYF